MNESLQTMAARKPVRRGGGGCRSCMLRRSVRETAAAAICVSENTNPKRSGEEQGGAASQDKVLSVVTAERPQGTASTERILFARRQ
jgi:hypothetical protein